MPRHTLVGLSIHVRRRKSHLYGHWTTVSTIWVPWLWGHTCYKPHTYYRVMGVALSLQVPISEARFYSYVCEF